jgi:hypothetical protein
VLMHKQIRKLVIFCDFSGGDEKCNELVKIWDTIANRLQG